MSFFEEAVCIFYLGPFTFKLRYEKSLVTFYSSPIPPFTKLKIKAITDFMDIQPFRP